MWNIFSSLLTVAALAATTFAAAADEIWIKDDISVIGKHFCRAVGPNEDCPWILTDANDAPQFDRNGNVIMYIVASRDIKGDYWLNPTALSELWMQGSYPQFEASNILAFDFASTVRISAADQKAHVEIRKDDAAAICEAFDEDGPNGQFVGFFPMLEIKTIEYGQRVQAYGPSCFAWLKTTPNYRESYARMFPSDKPLLANEKYSMSFIGLLEDGRWYIDYGLLDYNGLLDVPVKIDGFDYQLKDLLYCRPENEGRRGCRNTVASFDGGEAGLPFLSLVKN